MAKVVFNLVDRVSGQKTLSGEDGGQHGNGPDRLAVSFTQAEHVADAFGKHQGRQVPQNQ